MSFTSNNQTRRAVLGGMAALGAFAAFPALALTDGEARNLIDRAVTDITTVINSGRSESAMYGEFEKIFARYADVPTIARSALGPDARSASASQMRAFSDAFQGYMARKYGKRFREFIGGTVTVQDSRAVKSFFAGRAPESSPGADDQAAGGTEDSDPAQSPAPIPNNPATEDDR